MTEASALCLGILAACLVLGYKKPGIAFATAPIATCLAGYVAVVTDTPENFLILVPAIFIGTMVVVAATGRDAQTRQWFHWGAWYLLIGIGAMFFMGVVLMGLGAFGRRLRRGGGYRLVGPRHLCFADPLRSGEHPQDGGQRLLHDLLGHAAESAFAHGVGLRRPGH